MRKAMSPVATLTRAAARIHEGNLNGQLPLTGSGDEFDQLTGVFNAMTARLDSSFNRIREFTLHASHELKTPLAIMHGQLETFMHVVRSLSVVGIKPTFATQLQIFLYPKQDYGVILMIAALLLLTARPKTNAVKISHRWLILGWGSVVLIPCMMMARGSFVMMYFYMVIIPLSLSILGLLTVHAAATSRRAN